MKGGFSTKYIFELVLGSVVVLIIIAALNGGALFKTIDRGYDLVKQGTDYTVDVDDEKKLSQAALYVYHRASNDGCKEGMTGAKKPTVWMQNNGKIDNRDDGLKDEIGYPALSGTHIGRKPPCVGASSKTGLRGVGGTGYEYGYDMEGTFSRVQFEITGDRPVILSPDIRNGKEYTWLDRHIVGARKGGFESRTLEKCSPADPGKAFFEGATWGASTSPGLGARSLGKSFLAGATNIVVDKAATTIEGGFIGTGNNYVVFVEPDINNSRGTWLDDVVSGIDLSDKTYCTPVKNQNEIEEMDLRNSPIIRSSEETTTGIVLCPGDRGYIQMNKGKPQQDGEAAEDASGGAKNFPYIQVTEKGDYKPGECGVDLRGDPPRITNSDPGDVVTRTSTEWIDLEVPVKNRRKTGKKYAVKMISGDGSSSEVSDWKEIPAGGTERLSVSKPLRRFGETGKWGCEVTLKVKEKDVETWESSAVKVNLAGYVGGCGEGPPVEGSIENVEFGRVDNSEPWNPLPDKIEVDVDVQNTASYDGQFRTYYYNTDTGERKAKLPKLPSPWNHISSGGRETISGKIGETGSYNCRVRIVLREDEPQGKFKVDEVTRLIPGSVSSGC